MSDEQAAAYLAASNRLVELGGWDDSELAALLSEVAAADADLARAAGFDDAELARLLASAQGKPEARTDPDDAPPAPTVPVSKPGDVWLLGPHRVVCGDSTSIDVVNRAVNARSVDLLWTDPPYGVDYVGGTKDRLTIANDDLDDEHLEKFLADAFASACTVLRPGAAYYVAAPAGYPELAFRLALRAANLPLRQAIVWVKDRFTLGRQDHQWQHESILYGWQEGADPQVPPHFDAGHDSVLYGWKPGAAHEWNGGRKQTTVWEIPRPSRSTEHPTMKPVALMARAIENSTVPGALVLDLFGGSGSTLIAAHGTRRVAALIELDPRYTDVICRRYQAHTGTVPILEATGEPHDFTGA